MAMFENVSRRVPLGVFLIRKNLITERDIDTALSYQKEHPDKRIGEIFHILKLCKDEDLLNAIAERLEVKPIIIDPAVMDFNYTNYLSMDIIKQHKVLPFGLEENRLKVAFADPEDKKTKEMVQRILLNKG